jgi:hypothetical protein
MSLSARVPDEKPGDCDYGCADCAPTEGSSYDAIWSALAATDSTSESREPFAGALPAHVEPVHCRRLIVGMWFEVGLSLELLAPEVVERLEQIIERSRERRSAALSSTCLTRLVLGHSM